MKCDCCHYELDRLIKRIETIVGLNSLAQYKTQWMCPKCNAILSNLDFTTNKEARDFLKKGVLL